MKLRNKKTGEIIRFYDGITLNGEDYDSLAELNEEWEDYMPKAPLIKDEKIRKAVRAWAEVDALVLVAAETDYRIESVNDSAVIRFDEPVFRDLPKGRNYTITELCGEEEKEEEEDLRAEEY